MLVFNILLVPNVQAEITYQTGFEGGTITQQFSNAWLSTDNITPTGFFVDSTLPRSGTRIFKITNMADGYWNYSYSGDSVITKWSVWFYPYGSDMGHHMYFNDGNDVTIIELYFDSLHVDYYDHLGNPNRIGQYQDTDYNYFEFEILKNDTIVYSMFNVSGIWVNKTDTPRNVVIRPTIASLYWHGLGAVDHGVSFDDHNLTIDTDFAGDAPEFGDVSSYGYIGNTDYANPLFRYATAKYFEEKRFVAMTCDVKAVDLLVARELYSFNPDLSKYQLKVMGESVGAASYWVPHGNDYLLRWIDFTVSLDNQKPVLEFYHSEYAFTNNYWYGIGHTSSGDDIDNDGEQTFKYHSNANQFNGIYDGTTFNSDLIYRMYYEGAIYRPPQTYEDLIDTDKNSYEQFETVTVIGSVSTLLYANRLVINKSGVEYVNKTISGYTFSEFFTPTLEGNYNASIYRDGDGIIETCSFTVSITSLEHYIYTVSNPSRPIENFNVYFKYNYTTVPCAIVLFNNRDLVKPLKIWTYDTVPINDSFSYILDDEGIYYFDLCSYSFDNATSQYIYTTIKRHRHICKNEYPNQLNVVYDVVDFGQGQIVYGSHNFLGSAVVIKMNGEVAFSLSDISEFETVYVPQYSGEYNATLVIMLSDTTIVLDYALFSVSGDQLPPAPEPPKEDTFGLPQEYMDAMFGALITLGFLLLPFLMSKGKASNIIYAIFGGVGLGVSTLAGFFPVWLPLMITVLMVTILVIEYKKGK